MSRFYAVRVHIVSCLLAIDYAPVGLRVFFELASSLLALKLFRDVYLDRSNLSELWKAPRRYKTARIFRVSGFLAALTGVITQCVTHLPNKKHLSE